LVDGWVGRKVTNIFGVGEPRCEHSPADFLAGSAVAEKLVPGFAVKTNLHLSTEAGTSPLCFWSLGDGI